MREKALFKKTKIKRELTQAEKVKKGTDITLLVLLTLSFFGLLFVQLYQKMSDDGVLVTNIILTGFFVIFVLEYIYRWFGMTRNGKGKENAINYFKFNKAEPLYFLVMLILTPFVFIFAENAIVELFQWVLLLKAPSILRNFNDEKVFNVIVKGMMLVLIAFFTVPFLNVIAMAFSSPNPIINIIPIEPTLYSFKFIFSENTIFKAFGISIFVTVFGTLISVFSMAMAAYPLSKKEMPLRKTMTMFFIIVMLFSGGMAPNIILIDALGMIDTVWALVFPSVVMVFHLLLLKGYFEGIPKELEESAKLDGANNYRILLSIILPIAIPMMATVVLFTAISYWNNMNNSILYIIGRSDLYPIPMYIKSMLDRNPLDIAFANPEILKWWENIRMAYILVSILPIACLYPFVLKFFAKGASAGAVKG